MRTGASFCPSDRSRGWVASSIPGARRSGRARALRPVADSVSAWSSSCLTLSGWRRSAGVCGTSPTSRRACAGETVCGSVPPVLSRTVTVPVLRGPVPCRAHSKEDLPEPLRPISAVTSPSCRVRSTSRTAGTPWWATVVLRAVSSAGRSWPGAVRGGAGERTVVELRPDQVAAGLGDDGALPARCRTSAIRPVVPASPSQRSPGWMRMLVMPPSLRCTWVSRSTDAVSGSRRRAAAPARRGPARRRT